MSEAKPIKRRDFLKVGAAGAAAAGGLRLARMVGAAGPNGSSPHSWAMVIDQAKCTGCGYCTLACRARNDIAPEISWTRVLEAGEIRGKKVYLPRPCQHCENAPCVEVCMVGASYYRPDGIVMMDYDKCIGCRYCQIACPYNARAFNWETYKDQNPAVPTWGQPEVERRPRGVVEKCSFCYQRIDRGLQLGLTPGLDKEATPACVMACPVGARVFGDLNDPESNVSKLLASHHHYRLREDLGTAPRVYYLPSREVSNL
jgi:phenylacetyl-CoA:acceptor oxidoreductase 27-kDa subunit